MIKFLWKPKFGYLDLVGIFIVVELAQAGQYLYAVIVAVVASLIGAVIEVYTDAT